MTRRERLRRCYFHEELDRPAVYSRTGFPEDDPTYDRLKAFLAAQTELKGGWNGLACAPTPPTETVREPHTADFDREVTRLRTPAGTLRSTFLASRHGLPGMHESFFITTREDAETYLSLPQPAPAGETASFFDADRAMGDRGIVEVQLGLNPAGFTAELCGSETFAVLTLTDRDIVHALCEHRMRTMLATVRFLLDRGIGPYFAMLGEEYLVPPLHGPRDFDDFNVRYDKPILDLIHDTGGRVHIHSHGSIRHVLPGFLAMGADVLHPFEAPPMGDITPREAKDAVRGRICLEGNLQIADLYDHTPDAVRAHTTALIADAFDDGRGLIVCPTASPFIRGAGEQCFPQYQAMIDTVINWRATCP